jgi:flavorubredoxin
MNPIEIAPGVYDVGVTDWNIRDFHGYSTDLGTTYNAFLVIDEKIALIDSVKKEFADQLIENISRIVDPKKIDFIVSNHTEPDHSGGLARVMHRVGEDKPLYCSKMGHKNLPQHFTQKWNYHAVSGGEELKLGRRTLTFMETRMVHWPDSMFTYLKEDGILFASDGFGQHYAGPEKFDDQVGDRIMAHAKKYFANILLPYAPLIEKLIQQVQAAKLDLRMICPDHGIIWRRDPGKIVAAYQTWCRQEPEKKAVIIYDTMWKSTQTAQPAGMASQRGHDGAVRRPGRAGRLSDAQQRHVPDRGGFPVLHEGPQAQEQDRGRLRLLRLERGGRDADRKRAGRHEDRTGTARAQGPVRAGNTGTRRLP